MRGVHTIIIIENCRLQWAVRTGKIDKERML